MPSSAFPKCCKSELLGPHQVPQYKEYAGDIHRSRPAPAQPDQRAARPQPHRGRQVRAQRRGGVADRHRRGLPAHDRDPRQGQEHRAETSATTTTCPSSGATSAPSARWCSTCSRNAIKFTPQSGKVTSSVVAQRRRRAAGVGARQRSGHSRGRDRDRALLRSARARWRKRPPNRAPVSACRSSRRSWNCTRAASTCSRSSASAPK